MTGFREAVSHPGMSDGDDIRALLPSAPSDVPKALTEPSPAYKRAAWIATLGLLGFVAVYLSLTFYFGYLAYRFLHAGVFPGILVALPALFFFGFLVRGLFVVKHAMDPCSVEIREADEPRLFAFLHALADETRAPRPHRVFLSARVNASVFYDLSFINLVIPSKKNLEIGLGLVNALTLDELKAVVAHEFGHFAQRTMAVGRWVYVAQQIAGHVIMARTGFDRVLTFISNTDIRVAWIGWVMRLFVWAIRAVLDTFFRMVVLAHRALGRHMEFQADRVAVSVSGSDSLIHALHRLGPADDAWSDAVGFADEETIQGRPVADLFSIQTAALAHHRRIFDEPDLGATPRMPASAHALHRVFETELASPPRMWATHPPNREREDNAKAIYLRSVLDDRPAWALFADPDRVRKTVTRAFYTPAKPPEKPLPEPVPEADSLARFEARYRRSSLDPRYRGAYLGRAIAAYHPTAATMVATTSTPEREALLARLAGLYPDSLRALIEGVRAHRREEAQLDGLALGVLSAPGGVIRHRGEEIRRKDLPRVIEVVRAERRALEQQLIAHDADCRAAHRDAARALGEGWPALLESLGALLHYATHASRNLRDAHGCLANVVDIVLADGSVSAAERRRVIAAASDVQEQLEAAFRDYGSLVLPPQVSEAFEARGGFTTLSKRLGMGAPTEENIGDWLGVVDGWVNGAVGDLGVLAEATLDVLLDAEDHVARCYAEGVSPNVAPAPAKVPTRYATCLVDAERPRQKRLDLWDRFQTADGFFPGAARFTVASLLLVPALFVGGSVGTETTYVYNALADSVVVDIAGRTVSVGPGAFATIEREEGSPRRVVARTLAGRPIEAFDAPEAVAFETSVYNVAQAGVLVQWTATYGSVAAVPERPIGAPRWYDADEDVVLRDPPESVSGSGSGAQRTVLTILDTNADVSSMLGAVASRAERRALAEAHLRFDPLTSDALVLWAMSIDRVPEARGALHARAVSAPSAIELQRAFYEASTEPARAAQCARHDAELARRGDDADLRYLAARCIEDVVAQDQAFLAGYAAHPEHPYLALAAGDALTKRAEWSAAMAAFQVAIRGLTVPIRRDVAERQALRTFAFARHLEIADVDAPSLGPAAPRTHRHLLERVAEDAASAGEWPVVTAYRHLRRGELDAAVAVPLGRNEDVIALAAASDGATDVLVDRGIGLPIDGLGATSVHLLYALALREGRDPARHLEAIEDEGLGIEGLAEAFAAGTVAERVRRIDALAATLGVFERGLVLAMGSVWLGDDAPPAWREGSRAALFVTERPYFR